MTTEDFIELVRQMRVCQKGNTQEYLRKTRALEKQVDDFLAGKEPLF